MANPGYVRSTDGSDADNGSTWALANSTIAGAITDAVAGDTIYVSQNHAQSGTGTITMTFPGSIASPNKIICGNDAAQPPTSVATTGSIANTNGSSVFAGSFYMRGIKYLGGSGGSAAPLTIGQSGSGKAVLHHCVLDFSPSTSVSNVLNIGQTNSTVPSSVDLISCDIKFGNASQGIAIRGAQFRWRGGSILSGGTSPSTLITSFGAGSSDRGPAYVLIEGVDLSNLGASSNLCTGSAIDTPGGLLIFRNCKLPASWSGSLLTAFPSDVGFRAEMHNCDSTDTNYRLRVVDMLGAITSETTIVRSGGASNGTTTLSWKMEARSQAQYPHQAFESVEIPFWINSTGAKTATVEIVHDSVGGGGGADLTNAEIWGEVQYLGTSGFPLGSFANNAKADVLATAADHTNSSESWTTTGLTTPVKQKLTVSFTVNEIGPAIYKVFLAKPSTTVYVDPKVTVA